MNRHHARNPDQNIKETRIGDLNPREGVEQNEQRRCRVDRPFSEQLCKEGEVRAREDNFVRERMEERQRREGIEQGPVGVETVIVDPACMPGIGAGDHIAPLQKVLLIVAFMDDAADDREREERGRQQGQHNVPAHARPRFFR